MQRVIGGQRLGSGKKMTVNMHSYERSNHDLSHTVRTTMNAGTLVPVFKQIGLPGDTWDLNTAEMLRTIPTNNALFGSFKYRIDFFVVPLRLTVGALHNNMLGVGQNIDKIVLPKIRLQAKKNTSLKDSETNISVDNQQIAPDSLNRYLGIAGVGLNLTSENISREFLGVYHIGYYDICKNYYINKQESNAYVIGHSKSTEAITEGYELYPMSGNSIIQLPLAISMPVGAPLTAYVRTRMSGPTQIDLNKAEFTVNFGDVNGAKTLSATVKGLNNTQSFNIPNTPGGTVYTPIQMRVEYVQDGGMDLQVKIKTTQPIGTNVTTYIVDSVLVTNQKAEIIDKSLSLTKFPIENLDMCRTAILKNSEIGEYVTIVPSTTNSGSANINYLPYSINADVDEEGDLISKNSQVGLMVKTHFNDLFNNFVKTDWIEQVNQKSSIQVTGNVITMDSLLIAKKVFNYLNRVMLSGGTLQDWQEVTYSVDAQTFVESPIYVGGVSGDVVFDEVVSTASTETEALGTLAGRGNINYDERQGGRVNIKIKEPSIIIGIASITPRVDYYQGNDWDVCQINTLDDLHKPEFDGIGFQDLPSEMLAWWDAQIQSDGSVKTFAIGKQPAWIQYMTDVNRVYGDFARENNLQGMVIARKYKPKEVISQNVSSIKDASTYIDPLDYNYLFAGSSLEDQPFWMQIHFDVKVRRKMSAAIMPQL